MHDPAFVLGDVGCQRAMRVRVDDGPDVRREELRVADDELVHRTVCHAQDLVRRVLGQAEQAQRRAPLTRAVERRRQRVADDLLGQRRAVDDHRVDAAGLRDQRRERPFAGGERRVDRARGLDGARERDAGDVRIGQHRLAEGAAVARQEL